LLNSATDVEADLSRTRRLGGAHLHVLPRSFASLPGPIYFHLPSETLGLLSPIHDLHRVCYALASLIHIPFFQLLSMDERRSALVNRCLRNGQPRPMTPDPNLATAGPTYAVSLRT